ncbi:MAG: PAS domain-containing protein [Treponema sp.]|jgi:PAS domain S-box-containing protein|nr:PAS domain-containing protein [Treponema sp.]
MNNSAPQYSGIEVLLSESRRLLKESGSKDISIKTPAAGVSPEIKEIFENLSLAIQYQQYSTRYEIMKYKLAEKALQAGLWDMDVTDGDPVNPDNVFIWSDEFRQMLGFTGEKDFPNRLNSWSDRLHPEDKERTLDAFTRHLTDYTGKTPFNVEYRLKIKNGEYRYFQALGDTMRKSTGEPVRAAGLLRDIHDERKQNEIITKAHELNELQLAKLKLVVQAAKIGLWDTELVKDDPTNLANAFNWSDQIRKMLGYANELDFPNVLNSLTDLLHPDDKERAVDNYVKHLLDMTGKTSFDTEYRLLKKNGEYGYFHAYGESIRDKNGYPLRIAGALKDITEEKKIASEMAKRRDEAEAELEELVQKRSAEREKHYALLGIINEAAAFLLESEPENYENAIAQGFEMICCYTAVDRFNIWQNHRGDDGKLRYKMLYQWTKEGFSGVPLGTTFLYQDVSPMLEKILAGGKSVSGPISRLSEQARRHLEQYGIQSELVVPVFLKGEFWGLVSYDDLSSQRFFTKEEEYALRSWGIIVVSIMQRGEIARDMRHTLVKLEAASHAKSMFLANMSHELRTPMNSVIGFSELALYNAVNLKTKEYLKKIIDNSGWLLQIINDILDISKIESGKMELENIPFDLHELFSACRVLITPKAEEKGIALHFYAEPFIGKKLMGDPTRLRQVIINMLSNAVKFTNTGSVKMAASVSEKTGTANGDITIHFEIKDTGIGMTSEQIVKIFEPFTQAESGTTRKYGGTGLGLAITKNIIDLMGGTLSVESAPGLGSKFSFEMTFKTTDIPEHERFSGNKQIEKPVFDGEILLCEDNKMNQQLICEHLARVGLKTVVAENGREGVEAVKQRIQNGEKRFDLIFMDIHMPVMDGLEAAAEIIKLKTETPVIAMTANVMSDDREQYIANGMADCMGKPFTSQELWKCLLRHLTPVKKQSVTEIQFAQADEELRQRLIRNFIKEGQNRYNEIDKAIESGDIKLAHRLVHGLKGNAGQLGKTDLQKAAAVVESHLLNEKNIVTPEEMNALKAELDAALKEFSLMTADTAVHAAAPPRPIDAKEARALIEELEPLLKSGNPACLKLIEGLRNLPGSEKLMEQMEDFDFDTAAKTFVKLKIKWMEMN